MMIVRERVIWMIDRRTFSHFLSLSPVSFSSLNPSTIRWSFLTPVRVCSFKRHLEIAEHSLNCAILWEKYETNNILDATCKGEISRTMRILSIVYCTWRNKEMNFSASNFLRELSTNKSYNKYAHERPQGEKQEGTHLSSSGISKKNKQLLCSPFR